MSDILEEIAIYAAMKTLNVTLQIGLMAALFAGSTSSSGATDSPKTPEGLARRGQEMLRQMIEVNRYWLVSPPDSVVAYSYVFHLNDRDPMTVRVTDPRRASHAQRQGITWYSILQTIARKPAQAIVREMTETNGVVALSLRVEPGVRGHCGNGIEGTWTGYFNLGGDFAEVVIDLKTMTPLRSVLGKITETYDDFVVVDDRHLVPLKVTVEKEDSMRFDWKFRLYKPGLWLLDYSEYGGRKVAWADGVRVGDKPAQMQAAAAVSVEREAVEKAGSARLAQFMAANRHWLLPSTEARRGLVYDYEQEGGYRERVMFDGDGNLMVRLESTKDKPGVPTGERLWTVRGQKVDADHDAPFVKTTELPEADRANGAALKGWLHQDRAVQHLAMGLALECAVTRLARESEAFGGETLPVKNDPGRYLLVLHPRGSARLFLGTMLMFTSWAYMHDVGYSRSEILCDAATHRPLEERDFDGEKLVGHIWFEDWLPNGAGGVPRRVRAVVPYEKDNRDKALEMNARFQVVRSGLWLLDQVESAFRGNGGSTGRVQLVTAEASAFEPIRNLLERQKTTEHILSRLTSGKSEVALSLDANDWQDVAVVAQWTEAAKESASWSEDRKSDALQPMIGVYRARAMPQPDGSLQVALEGITTASWKEFESEWFVTAAARNSETSKTSAITEIRAENSPAGFSVTLSLPPAWGLGKEPAFNLKLEGLVRRMTGAYHGHGIWYRFAREK